MLQQELKELEDKFRKAMFQNAQLDNEKASFVYQVELLKDQIEQLEEAHSQLQVRTIKTRQYLFAA
jgi:chromosome segregation ATPase